MPSQEKPTAMSHRSDPISGSGSERSLTSFEMTDLSFFCHFEPFGDSQDKLREESFPSV